MENQKNSIVQIEYIWNNEIWAKYNDILDRTNTFILDSNNPNTNISFEDAYCKYNIQINNSAFTPLYKFKVWVKNFKCSIELTDWTLQKFVQTSSSIKENPYIDLTTATPNLFWIVWFLFTFFLLWIVIINKAINKKSWYLGLK